MQVVDGSVHDAGNKASVTIISEVFSNHSKLESCATGSCVRVHFQNGTYSCHEVTLATPKIFAALCEPVAEPHITSVFHVSINS